MELHTTHQAQTAPNVSPDILGHPERRIRLPEVKALTGYSTASIYAKMADGSFPTAQKMGGRAVAWRLGDILKFLSSRPRINDAGEVAA